VSFPVTLLRVAMGVVMRGLEEVRATGSAAGLMEGIRTRQELCRLVGYEPAREWEWRKRR
jgi:2-methylisocitrate lyase-like PEP mutase family enzyme